ncbi:DEAD/DEAH box helicase (plasmid) [Halobacteriovorax sp. GFR7]|uniref:DEAD/DEAH box helicase n=1 Tax=unclassified Halobacteriovorax TaxID=2639665 RepID=UPI003D98B4CB
MLQMTQPAVKVDSLAWYADSQQLRDAYTFMSTFGDKVEAWMQHPTEKGLIGIPRMLAPEPTQETDFRSMGEHVDYAAKLSFKPRNMRQKVIISQALPMVRNLESFVLCAGTGTGKTVLAGRIMAEVNRKTIIVVDQENIMQQWIDMLQKVLGMHQEEIGIIQGDICQTKGRKVVIAMLHSISKIGRYPEHIYDEFGLAIFDEVHVCAADQFKNAMYLLKARIRIGLSATPWRKDGKHKLIFGCLGQVRIKSESTPLVPKVILAKSPWVVPSTVRTDEYGFKKVVKLPHSAGKTMHVNKALARNHDRNMMIANFVKQAYEVGRNIVIFSDLKDYHLDRIHDALVSIGIPSADIGRYTGGMTQKQREYGSTRRVVLTTYKATAKAVDCPWWDTAVLATPRSDVNQICGRILREYESKVCATAPEAKEKDEHGNLKYKVPVVYDIVDDDSTVFKSYFRGRLKYYEKQGTPFTGNLGLLSSCKLR